jgi:xanthine dehydrogenase FAD-binding subunit
MALLAELPDSKILSGGTDLLIRLREGKHKGVNLIDITGVEDLTRVYLDQDDSLHIGSLQTFRSLEENPLIGDLMPGLKGAASSVGGPQIRAAATLGGNLCNGAPSADSAPILFCARALLSLASPGGERLVEIADFYKGPGQVDLKPGEILREIIIRSKDYRGFGGHYMKFSQREAMDIATLGCALMVNHEEGVIRDLRIAYGVAGPTPRRCVSAEKAMTGLRSDKTTLKEFARLVQDELLTRDSWRGSKAFRDHLAGVLAYRGLAKLTGQGECDHD